MKNNETNYQGKKTSDRQIIEAILKGGREEEWAFSFILDQMKPYVLKKLRKFGEDREDGFMQSLIHFREQIKGGNEVYNLKRYLFKSTKNHCLQNIEKAKKKSAFIKKKTRSALEENRISNWDSFEGVQLQMLKSVGDKDRNVGLILLRFLRDLFPKNPLHRTITKRHFWDGWSIHQIEMDLGKKVSNILKYCIQRIKDYFFGNYNLQNFLIS